MIRQTVTGFLALMVASTIASSQDAAETEAWETARESTSTEVVFDFIATYPNSTYAKDAKARMIDLLWEELAEANATSAPSEAAPVSDSLEVSFSQPLTEGATEIVGRSLEELLLASPMFPPLDGMADEHWKEQECSSCHEWQQANLCTQATTYLSDAGAENLGKKHPYGGTFKLNLRNWAQGGCE